MVKAERGEESVQWSKLLQVMEQLGMKRRSRHFVGLAANARNFDRRSTVNCAIYGQLPSGHRGHVPTSERCGLNGL